MSNPIFVNTTDNKIVAVMQLVLDAAPGYTYLNQFKDYVGEAGLDAYARDVASYAAATVDELATKIVASLNIAAISGAETAAQAEVEVATLIEAGGWDNRGQTILDLIDTIVTLQNDPMWGAAANAFVTSVNTAYVYSVNPANTSTDLAVLEGADEQSDAEVIDNIYLDAATDLKSGTSVADSFVAYLSQNATAGGVSNTLSSADRLDGKAGTDTLFAELVPEFFGTTGDNQVDVQPRTTSIEDIMIEARDSGSNDVNDNVLVTVDAKNMTAVERIGSTFSDGDLVIENLTTLTDAGTIRDTEAITVVMDHTDNFDSDNDASDLTVLFDEDYLGAGKETQYSIELRIVNAYQLAVSNEPLTGFLNVSFDVGATRVNVDVEAADTYAEVVAAINAELALKGITTVTAAALPDRDAIFTDDVGTYAQGSKAGDYTPILLSSTSEALTAGPIELDSNVKDYNGLNTWTNAASLTTSNLVTVNIELEKVGRDGDGGDLVVGGKDVDNATVTTPDIGATASDTDVDQTDGIQVFNIAVRGTNDQPSNLGTISSTNNYLKTVYVTDHSTWNGADLKVRQELGQGVGNELTLIDATEFSGDFSLAMSNTAGQHAVTSKFGVGNDSYKWESRDDVEPGAVQDDDGDIQYSISMGAGNDTVIADLDGDAVDARGESFSLDTGTGNDNVTLDMDDDVNTIDMEASVSYRTMDELHSIFTTYLEINTGAGDDRVQLDDYGTFEIVTGDGNDYVETDAEDGTVAVTGASGAWTAFADAGIDTFERVLYKAQLTVSFAGFEETVTINTTSADNYIANQALINTEIIRAIESNTVLNEFLDYNLAAGNQRLTITSDIDGQNSLAIAIYQPQLRETQATVDAEVGSVLISGTDVSALRKGLIATETVDSDDVSDAADIEAWTGNAANDWFGVMNETGVANTTRYASKHIEHDTAETPHDDVADILDSVAAGRDFLEYDLGGSSNDTGALHNYSTIDVGSGDNIIVLDSNVDSSQTIRISGTFGTTTIVNFFDVAPDLVAADATSVGEHALDFRTYLTGMTDASTDISGNTDSAVRDNTALVVVDTAQSYTDTVHGATVGSVINANDVAVMRFDSSIDANDNFAGLTNTNLLAALNNKTVNEYGNIDDALLTATATANLIGATQNHILMVENDLNEGEYKVFHLTSTIDSVTKAVTNGDFTSANLLGTLDFGASVNLNLRGNATYEALLDTMLAEDDGVEVVNPEATYVIEPDMDTVIEGGTVTFNIATNLPEGEEVNLMIAGDVDQDDFTVGVRSATVGADGNASATFTLKEDASTDEGDEIFTVAVKEDPTKSASVTVNDTSVAAGGGNTTAAKAISAAGSTTDGGATVNTTYTVSAANYTHTIAGFGTGDKLVFPTASLATVVNSDFTDGKVQVQYASNGTTTVVELTGIATATDGAIFGATSFKAAFGADSLN